MSLDEYQAFLDSKQVLAPAVGFQVAKEDLNPMLKPFQADICQWALDRGKAAVFAHTGLGKGPIQLEWLNQVHRRTQRNVLLLAPLAVSQQFKREAEKFHYSVTVCKTQADVREGINVTNYDRADNFDMAQFSGVALDESSCIKDWSSKTAQNLIYKLAGTPFKLCSTATPSPNDHSELGTHAELLDVLTRQQTLAMFFEHDGGNTSKWTLKGHAKKPFWKWVASWAVCLTLPSDLGYDDSGYVLMPLNVDEQIVRVDQSIATEGYLFRCPDLSATGLHKEMRLTCEARAERVSSIILDSWEGFENQCQEIKLRLKPTIESTTRLIGTNTSPVPIETCQLFSPNGESGTEQIQNTEQRSSPKQKNTTRLSRPRKSSTTVCENMGSQGKTITASSPLKAEDAGSVVLKSQEVTGDFTLTTATIQEDNEDFSVSIATLPSGNSITIPNSSEKPPISSKPPQWIVWCNTNYEQKALMTFLSSLAISIDGSMSAEEKESRILSWINNDRPILVTKPSVAGYGLNLQQCCNMAFVGLSYSFEQFFQAVRRCWRYGQVNPVNVHVVVAETEGPILANIRRKEAQFEELQAGMVEAMRAEQLQLKRTATRYDHNMPVIVPGWLKSEFCA